MTTRYPRLTNSFTSSEEYSELALFPYGYAKITVFEFFNLFGIPIFDISYLSTNHNNCINNSFPMWLPIFTPRC